MISNIQQRIQKQWELAMNLQTMVGKIPKMNQDIEEVMKVLGRNQYKNIVSFLSFKNKLKQKKQLQLTFITDRRNGRGCRFYRESVTSLINTPFQFAWLVGNLESSFGDVEISLLALEDTIDARELQERQLDQRFQLAMYQERRKAEFNELSSKY